MPGWPTFVPTVLLPLTHIHSGVGGGVEVDVIEPEPPQPERATARKTKTDKAARSSDFMRPFHSEDGPILVSLKAMFLTSLNVSVAAIRSEG
jgi:hypothetical protein